MNIKFGIVEEYFNNKGFGFIINPFDISRDSNTFFHISAIKKSDLSVYHRMSNYEKNDVIYFWYEQEKTQKGNQLRRIIKANELSNILRDSFYGILIKKHYSRILKVLWKKVNIKQPVWLFEISKYFIEESELNELRLFRFNLEQKLKEEEELKRKEKESLKIIEEERLRQINEEKRKIEEEKKKLLDKEREAARIRAQQEDEEFESLVDEMKSKGFTSSSQVSNFIIRNRLGEKYKHISGVLIMENDDSTWKFNGGFPPKIYAKLCDRLNLGNKGTNSRVVDFTAFNDL